MASDRRSPTVAPISRSAVLSLQALSGFAYIYFQVVAPSTTACACRPKNNNGPSTTLRPLPVNCWDWTKATALPRSPGPCEFSSPGLTGCLGRDALGLSHLTYETTGTIFLHRLDHPPFPCIHNLSHPPPSVNGQAPRPRISRADLLTRCLADSLPYQLCSHPSSLPIRTAVPNSSLNLASVNISSRPPSPAIRPSRIRITRSISGKISPR